MPANSRGATHPEAGGIVPPSVSVDMGANDPFAHLLLSPPSFVGISDGNGGPRLTWNGVPDGPTGRAGWVLGPFVLIGDANEAPLPDLAIRFGPLGTSAASANPTAEPRHTTESVANWRALARSLAALLEAAVAVEEGRRWDPRTWAWAALIFVVAARLRSPCTPSSAANTIDEEEVDLFAMLAALDWPATDRHGQRALLRDLANRLLDASGVRADSGIGEPAGAGPLWTMPTTVPRDAGNAYLPAGVDGALPVLAIQAVWAILVGRLVRCTNCGRVVPLPPDAPSPRRGIPFYGDHEECRRAARLQSKRESRRRLSQRVGRANPA